MNAPNLLIYLSHNQMIQKEINIKSRTMHAEIHKRYLNALVTRSNGNASIQSHFTCNETAAWHSKSTRNDYWTLNNSWKTCHNEFKSIFELSPIRIRNHYTNIYKMLFSFFPVSVDVNANLFWIIKCNSTAK